MAKTRVVVIFGGQSTEHEVSNVSASSIIKNLDTNKYDITKVGITKDGRWTRVECSNEDIKSGNWVKTAVGDTFDTLKECINDSDVVFPVLHGLYGEDGTIQGLLELFNKPYVGCGIIGSAACMDKAFAKILFEYYNIPQAKYLLIKSYEFKKDEQEVIKRIEEKFSYPCFVKPSNSGSSVGISKAHNREELITAINLAKLHDKKILVEEFIDAREIECSVLGNEYPEASVLGEIVPSREFYDYDSKYNDGTSEILIPANLTEEVSNKIREYAVIAYKALECFGMSRIDFFVHKKTGEIFINEINTIPGFTSISMYPKLWEATGLSYGDLLDKLIDLALERRKN